LYFLEPRAHPPARPKAQMAMIAHVDMDAFYASVEVLDDPALAGRPVMVGGGKRGVVSAASYAARAYGVHSAMPLFQARRLCPHGVFLPVRMERYRQVSNQVMRVLEGFSPVVEQVSVDEAYVDLAGTRGLWGGPRQAGEGLKRAVRDATELTCSVGVAPLRFLAKIASDREKPDGLTVVEEVEPFLATVRLAEVPGVGAKSQARLAEMGFTRLLELRGLGRRRLEQSFGAWGVRLWNLAQGVDPRGVGAEGGVKSVSHEVTLESDTSDRELLRAVMLDLAQKVCRRLRRKGLKGRVAVLKLRHADLRLVTRRKTLAQASDQAGELFRAASGLLDAYSHPGPYRLVGVGMAGLAPEAQGQAALFGREEEGKGKALGRAEDEISRRFGEKAITRGGALTPSGARKPDP